MSDFLNDQYVLPPAVYPGRSAGVVPQGSPVPRAVPQPASGEGTRAIVPVFDSRPTNAQDIYREYVNAINFTVPQGFTFILRKLSAAGFSDSEMTKPVVVESGLLLNVTINGISSILSATDYGLASQFDAPVFVTIPESQVLGGSVAAISPLVSGTFNQWVPVQPAPAAVGWGRNAQTNGVAITASQTNTPYALTLDGKNFSYGAFAGAVLDLVAQNGIFMASANGVAQVYVSFNNGGSWTTHATPNVVGVLGAGGGMWVAYSGISNRVYLSLNNGASWSAGVALPGLLGTPQAIVWNPDAKLFVLKAVYTGGGTAYQIYSSPDGITWTLKYQSPVLVSGAYALAYANGVYLADFGTQVYRSTDLVTWTSVIAPAAGLQSSQWGNGLQYKSGVWRSVAVAGNQNYVSTDNGLTWTTEYNPLGISGTLGYIGDTFFELTSAGTGYDLTAQSPVQSAQGGLTMKFAIAGQLIPNTALPANMANRG